MNSELFKGDQRNWINFIQNRSTVFYTPNI